MTSSRGQVIRGGDHHLDAAVALFEVCPSDCDAMQGRVRIEVDAPDAPTNVEWAIRIEKKTDAT